MFCLASWRYIKHITSKHYESVPRICAFNAKWRSAVTLPRTLIAYSGHLILRDVLLTALPEPTAESHLQSDSVTKLTTDEETEVPPPPGTEPLLPIPAIVSSPEKEKERSQDPPGREKKERDSNDYIGERQSRERRRSFSRDGHRER